MTRTQHARPTATYKGDRVYILGIDADSAWIAWVDDVDRDAVVLPSDLTGIDR